MNLDTDDSIFFSHTVAGGWLGTYLYHHKGRNIIPTRFEATFRLNNEGEGFAGTILDDGELGEADITGSQQGRVVRFTKVYRTPSDPVQYRGTMSEDGQTMQGTWDIKLRLRRVMHGVWEARRLWSVEEEEEPYRIEASYERDRELLVAR